ncbi:alpha/beta fold hydrolase [Nonomuraea africana]|uniref:Pimeloyl-ACP methyl ester carboxylesterase n=1 Tax=Nonomuraea africana TaxID=46171 RepID=A0ABR9K5Q7_9ACTN|nr:alpha/beta hydrolase [Nonomuraea africana]MBE1557343.1 pimeloyl-ACP methyl ester carboxylesterase [Nonomuraea africana]
MPFTSVRDTDVHYEVEGQGPGLVLVHGTGGDADKVFGNVVHHFTATRTVVRPNFSGSGQTVDDGAELSVDLIAEQVATATREAVRGPVDLLGFSLGAVAAAAVAATHPDLVRRLILVGGWAHSTGPRDTFYFETSRKLLDTDRDLFKRFSALTGFSPAALDSFGHQGLAQSLDDAWPPPGIGRQIDLGAQVDIRALLPSITAPTLVVGFAGDNMIPLEGSRQLHAAIPGSRLVEIDEGHMDWFADPTRLIALTRDFLDEPAPAAA